MLLRRHLPAFKRATGRRPGDAANFAGSSVSHANRYTGSRNQSRHTVAPADKHVAADGDASTHAGTTYANQFTNAATYFAPSHADRTAADRNTFLYPERNVNDDTNAHSGANGNSNCNGRPNRND